MCEHLKAKIELYKLHLEKLWVAFIASTGGIGTLLFKQANNFTLLSIGFTLAFISLLGILLVHHKIERLIKELKVCEEERWNT